MAYLTKERSLFARDENGNLLPVEIELELLEDKPLVKVIPLTKGEIKRIYSETQGGDTTKNQDDEIILKNCVNPKYDEKEVKALKPIVANAIVTAIMSISLGVSQDEIQNSAKKKLATSFLSEE
jgi:hypothetical protein